jgi:nucleoside 2-deoxyribosyltransferase
VKPTKLYLAGGLFSVAESMFNRSLAEMLRSMGYEVWLPQEHQCCKPNSTELDISATFVSCLYGIEWAQVVIGNMDGPDPDSGTSAECGFAFRKRHILAFRTDFRAGGERESSAGYNLMLSEMATVKLNLPCHIHTDPVKSIALAIHVTLSYKVFETDPSDLCRLGKATSEQQIS